MDRNPKSLRLVATKLHGLDATMLLKEAFLCWIDIAIFGLPVLVVVTQKLCGQSAFNGEEHSELPRIAFLGHNDVVAEDQRSLNVIAVGKVYEVFESHNGGCVVRVFGCLKTH
jgi:hypothetical protein